MRTGAKSAIVLFLQHADWKQSAIVLFLQHADRGKNGDITAHYITPHHSTSQHITYGRQGNVDNLDAWEASRQGQHGKPAKHSTWKHGSLYTYRYL